MTRLPPAPELDWTEDGVPVDAAHGDVFFSAEDGLAETRAVFLKGCGLPEAWAGRRAFTVAELGFGTGLNVLALWQLWRAHRPAPGARLHMVSIEGYPLQRADAARALSRWPELSGLAAKLLASWPDRARGVQHLAWPEEGVRLTLHIDEVGRALAGADFAADAWFLDGFAPARNPAMWSGELHDLIAARSAPGARLASYTVAGEVRRGLAAAGFDVRKAPGHGRKRERLEAVLAVPPAASLDPYALRSPATPLQRVAVLGAGVAGAAMARALIDRGSAVTVFDPASGPAAGASGNPLGLVMPRLDAADTPTARLLVDAYLHARRVYADRPGVAAAETRQLPRDGDEAARFAKVLADPPLGLEQLEALAGGGLLHKGAMIIRPAALIASLLDGAETRFGAVPETDLDAVAVNGEAFDAIVLAHGMGLADVAPWLGLNPRLGQVEHAMSEVEAPSMAVASGDYALAVGRDRLWGATFEAHTGGPAEVSARARGQNDAALTRLAPYWRREALAGAVTSRAGVRATTPDRLPVAGPLPDLDAVLERFADVRTGARPGADAPLRPGLWLLGGLGSRGFTFAPWLAEMLAAQMFGELAPASRKAREAVSPMRALFRGLKRGQL